MKLFTLTFFWLTILFVPALTQQVEPTNSVDEARFERMIAIIQRTPVSKLDPTLPRRVALQDWLYQQGGPNVRISWVVRTAEPDHKIPDCVEADAMMGDGRMIIVWVAADHAEKKTPYVHEILVITGRDAVTGKPQSTQLDHLRDLPAFINKPQQNS